jgi:hypothetical protein
MNSFDENEEKGSMGRANARTLVVMGTCHRHECDEASGYGCRHSWRIHGANECCVVYYLAVLWPSAIDILLASTHLKLGSK